MTRSDERPALPPAPSPSPSPSPSPALPATAGPVDHPATSFTRLPASRWLRPGLLLDSAGRALVSGLLGQYADKREQMASIPPDGHLDLTGGEGPVWVDYVSDTGDGFDATYAVAAVLARTRVELATRDAPGLHHPTSRGRLLVMGGDQCYPSGTVQGYEDRLVGPYRAALPEVLPESEAPFLQVIPGNHDWYDGLTAFQRTFCQGRWVGGWRSRQSRSYFATRPAPGWWLWAVDIQFDTYLDEPQLAYFRALSAQLEPGDGVVLCSAKPSWVAATDEDVEAFATMDFLERTLVRPRGAHVRVALSGDRHHYARYEAADGAQRITAGGGGAYLSATHHLPDSICVPPPGSRARGKSPGVPHRRMAEFPDPRTSRRLALGAWRLPLTTPGLALLLGGVQALQAVVVGVAINPPAQGLLPQLREVSDALRTASPVDQLVGLVSSLGALVLALTVLLCWVAFTRHARTVRGLVAGGVHGLAQLTLGACTASVAVTALAALPGAWLLVGLVPALTLVGGVLAAELVAVYLLLADRAGINSNELFAAANIPDAKCFLRLRFDPDGDLVVHAVGLDRVPRRWRQADGPPMSPERWVPDAATLDPFLIEPPLRVRRLPTGGEHAGFLDRAAQ